MTEPKKLRGTFLGLVGAAVLLGAWAFQELAPAKKSMPKAPTISPTAEMSSSMPDAEHHPEITALSHSSETPSSTTVAPETANSLLAKINAALAANDDAHWEHVLNELFPALLVADRSVAARWVETLPVGERRTLLLRRLARAWGATDFAGAVIWISNLTVFSDQKAAFDEACLATAETNPAEAVRAWESFDFKEDDHVLENIVQNWARLDFAAAQAWVHERPASIQRDQAVARLAYVLAQTKPVDAANLVIRELPDGPAQTEAVISILHQWAKNDLPGATAWATRFPAGALADRAKSELGGLTQLPTGASSSP